MANSDKIVPQQSPLSIHNNEANIQTSHHYEYPKSFRLADLCLRVLLFALSLVAVIVTITSSQTKTIPVILPNMQTPILVSAPAKWRYTPAVVYMVVALSVSGLYSIITTLLSISVLFKSNSRSSSNLLPHIVILDTILFGILAVATGAAGSMAYTGLKGNSHVGWGKVCPIYDKFCWHVGSSIVLCLFASSVLLLLSLLSVLHMSKKLRAGK